MISLRVWPYLHRGPYPDVRSDDNQHSHGPRHEIGGDWLEFFLTACHLIQEMRRYPVNVSVTVGTGVDLDAIGAAHILQPDHMVALDIHERVAELARRIIDYNVRVLKPQPVVDVLQSDRLTSVRPGFQADLIYENMDSLRQSREFLSSTGCAHPYPQDLAC